MLFFGKSREEEEIEEEEQEFASRKPRLRRKPKKDDFKPWGKRERIIVFVALVISILLSVGFFISSRKISLPSLPKFSLEQTIILTPEND